MKIIDYHSDPFPQSEKKQPVRFANMFAPTPGHQPVSGASATLALGRLGLQHPSMDSGPAVCARLWSFVTLVTVWSLAGMHGLKFGSVLTLHGEVC